MASQRAIVALTFAHKFNIAIRIAYAQTFTQPCEAHGSLIHIDASIQAHKAYMFKETLAFSSMLFILNSSAISFRISEHKSHLIQHQCYLQAAFARLEAILKPSSSHLEAIFEPSWGHLGPF